MATSDDYCHCVVIYPRGGSRRADILKANLMTVDAALVVLRDDHAAYVAPGDVDAVIERQTIVRVGRD